MNITYFNSTAIKICQGVLNKLKYKKVQCKIFNWCKDIKCFVKQRFRTKDNLFHNNYVYNIVELNKETATLQDVLTKEKYIISIQRLDSCFRPYFAHTGHSVQGVTTDKKINIFDVESDFVDDRWVWTALTRCTSLDNLNLVVENTSVKLDYDFERMINNYKSQDIKAKRNINNNFITKDDIMEMHKKQKGKCIICKEQLNLSTIEGDGKNLSVDRLENSLSHLKSNCQLSCIHCNVSKK